MQSMPKFYSSKEIITFLKAFGFVISGQRGSHIKLKKESKTVIVPAGRKQLPIGTYISILKQAGYNKDMVDSFYNR